MDVMEVVGPTYYGLVQKAGGTPAEASFTEEEAEALIAEYDALGLRFRKVRNKGMLFIVARAPAEQFKAFAARKSAAWQGIKERVGYKGNLLVRENCCIPGYADFAPGPDWPHIVALIDATFGPMGGRVGPQNDARPVVRRAAPPVSEDRDEVRQRHPADSAATTALQFAWFNLMIPGVIALFSLGFAFAALGRGRRPPRREAALSRARWAVRVTYLLHIPWLFLYTIDDHLHGAKALKDIRDIPSFLPHILVFVAGCIALEWLARRASRREGHAVVDRTVGIDTHTCPRCGQSYPEGVRWCETCRVGL